ncbi:right-handed parallel beta-helix repeat-containing protein [Luteolibacter sp. LG18]|uniref:right-handed parallel beta-helix repeat-containing protein n=1 Tax=Luteolibacter sp. LG18 TaxID=2819286 RepID=UPI002B2AB218|nr:hypothetical protein llg_37230 [Luteolibacter sp. LG18]
MFPARFLASWLLVSALAGATEYHVTTTGSDSQPGTLAQPWRTIQKAASTAIAGDTVNVHAGTYAERVAFTSRSGTAAQQIVFRRDPGDAAAVLVTQAGVTPPNGTSAIITITDCSHLVLRDLEIADYKTSGTNAQQKAKLPVGIYIHGAGDGIKLRNCKVHDIWQSCSTLNDFGANGFGIAVYGDAAQPIDHLVIDGCEVYNLRTGASESVTLNGNVTNFTVTGNSVHDCNNIGIDFIGFEGGNATPALDQARNGICSGNTVTRIDSKFNPAYGGNFTTGGNNGTRSAPGLYVDGGRDIILERNHVSDCNYALSAGSENTGKVASGITVRNNLFHHCHVGGIVIGGSDTSNGGLSTSSFTNNTLYGNDTTGQGGGQFAIQHYVTSTIIQRNLMETTASFAQFVLKDNSTGGFADGAIDWNLYRATPAASVEFIWQTTAGAFATWQSAARDPHSTFITGSTGLAVTAPVVGTPGSGFALTATSPARNAGDSSAFPFTPASGEKDWAGKSRVAGGRVDIGADEYMDALQIWRDQWFSLPDGGPQVGASDDPDGDGAPNLIEYSQGMNPLFSDRASLPSLAVAGNTLTFRYRKAASEATYTVEQSTTLGGWITVSQTEQNDGAGLYWRSVPVSGNRLFLRLRVTSAQAW